MIEANQQMGKSNGMGQNHHIEKGNEARHQLLVGGGSMGGGILRIKSSLSAKSSSGKGNLQMIKKNSAFSTKFFANFHYFCILFPSSHRNSTKPQHFTMHHYSAKQHSGIIY
jgi:hypothetical protein